MPGPAFFREFGFFVLENFLEPTLCAALCTEICRSQTVQGMIVGPSGEEVTDTEVRRVSRVRITSVAGELIAARLSELQPQLESHFETPLVGTERPNLL